MSFSNGVNTNEQQTNNNNTTDITESLKWELSKKSDLGDSLTILEPSEASGMSSGPGSAILEINNLLKLTHIISPMEPTHSDHLTTPMVDLWLYEVQINNDKQVIKSENNLTTKSNYN